MNCPFCKKELPTGPMPASEYARLFGDEQPTTEPAWRTPELVPFEDAVKAAEQDYDEKTSNWKKLFNEHDAFARRLGQHPLTAEAESAVNAAFQLRESAGETLQKVRAELHRAQVRLQNQFAIAEYKAQIEAQQQKMQAKESAKHQGLIDRAKSALTGGLKSRLVGA